MSSSENKQCKKNLRGSTAVEKIDAKSFSSSLKEAGTMETVLNISENNPNESNFNPYETTNSVFKSGDNNNKVKVGRSHRLNVKPQVSG